jgi:predicted protein tyrosine phosphatase
MRQIQVHSAESVCQVLWHNRPFSDKPYVLISITDAKNLEDMPVRFHATGNLKAILHLPFIDIPPSRINPAESILDQFELDNFAFDDDRIERLLEFVHQECLPERNIIVHCEAGVSRSQAIAAFLEVYLDTDTRTLDFRLHDHNTEFFTSIWKYILKNDLRLHPNAAIFAQVQAPIHQKFISDDLFSDNIPMPDYVDHPIIHKGKRIVGPKYPSEQMLCLTDRIRLQEHGYRID